MLRVPLRPDSHPNPELSVLQAPALLVSSYRTHTQNGLRTKHTHPRNRPSPRPSRRALRPSEGSSGSAAESKAPGAKKSKRKSAADVPAAVALPPRYWARTPRSPSPRKSKATTTAAESVSVSAAAAPILTASSSLPGAFDGAPGAQAKKKASAASVSAKASPPSAPVPVPAPAPAPEAVTPTPPAAAAPVSGRLLGDASAGEGGGTAGDFLPFDFLGFEEEEKTEPEAEEIPPARHAPPRRV
ncbi:hypothetical protein B0H14DRAFT_3443534 [Mycena olivaceomarginata]|nr:hypothetical protein B0H14DRAFT_3443534 [Mycena olivaceomarginata]